MKLTNISSRLARLFRTLTSRRSKQPNLFLGRQVSDSRFLLLLGEAISQSGLSPQEFETHHRRLSAREISRESLAQQIALQKIRELAAFEDRMYEPGVWLMGTRSFSFVTNADWEALASRHFRDNQPARKTITSLPLISKRKYIVSAIASVYKGEKFIKAFLENIVAQTIFKDCELIIIDANSPENEKRVIDEYIEKFDNIVYHRTSRRVGVYDAWNMGVSIARGEFITNTNVDDLRDPFSFEHQASSLQQHAFVDVVYQDFYYSLDQSCGLAQCLAMNLRSQLPLVTVNNMLMFNSPHNGPMWRKALHEEIGLFDTSFKSAGDYEFWLRCLDRGKTFLRLPLATVVYFHNPTGISTERDSPGRDEGDRLQKRYRRRLISNFLQMPDADFLQAIGSTSTTLQAKTRFECVSDQLLTLRTRMPFEVAVETPPSSVCRVLVDGAIFQLTDSDWIDWWSRVIQQLSSCATFLLVVLNRGGAPDFVSVDSLAFPAWTSDDQVADSLLVERICQEHRIDVFLSSHYSTSTITPSVFVKRPIDDGANQETLEAQISSHHASCVVELSPLPLDGAAYDVALPTQECRRVLSTGDYGCELSLLESTLRKAAFGGNAAAKKFHEQWHVLRCIQRDVDTWP